ncbi:MAG: FHA domain-containing protein, partial [Candidatus Thiodiazotropha taylori]
MFEIHYQQGRKRRSRHTVKGDRCVIGSARHSDLVIKHRHIAKRHATLYAKDNQVHIEDHGSITGTWVNRERVINYGPLNNHDEITIGDVSLRVELDNNRDLVFPQISDNDGIQQNHTQENALGLGDINQQGETAEEQKIILYWTRIIHEQLISEMDLRRKDVHSMSDDQLRVEAENLIDQIIVRLKPDLPDHFELGKLRVSVLNEAVGLGPLERFIE